MKLFVVYFISIFLFIGSYDFGHCHRIRAIPGIPSMTHFDKQYVEDAFVRVRRYGRGKEYTVNIGFTNKHSWNNNVSFHFIFYEFLHNEYRPSFVEMHYKYCDLIQKDVIIGPVIKNAGMTCPLPVGTYSFGNMTYNREFPSVFPFEKGKVELIGKIEANGKEFVRAGLTLEFKMLKS